MPNNLQKQRAALIDFLNSVARPGHLVDDVDDEINLVNAGVIDSLAVIQIIFYLEQNYNLDLQSLDIDPSELVSLGGILKAMDRPVE